jgi:hypothetical protein
MVRPDLGISVVIRVDRGADGIRGAAVERALAVNRRELRSRIHSPRQGTQ